MHCCTNSQVADDLTMALMWCHCNEKYQWNKCFKFIWTYSLSGGHRKMPQVRRPSQFSQVSGMENFPNFQQWECPQIARFIGPTWGPPGSCRPQVGPMLAPWTLLSGSILARQCLCTDTVSRSCQDSFEFPVVPCLIYWYQELIGLISSCWYPFKRIFLLKNRNKCLKSLLF